MNVVKKILLVNIVCVLFVFLHVGMAVYTSYSLNNVVLLTGCIGLFLSVIMALVYMNTISAWIKQKVGSGVGLVVFLLGLLVVELIALCVATLMLFVLLFKLGAKEKASGKGYEIRSEPALEWPERYVLYKNAGLMEQYMGDIRANEEDFEIEGKITAISIKADSIYVQVSYNQKDTVCIFSRK
jgi:hypothetical protein